MDLPKIVYSRGRTEKGTPTGGTRRCALEGCTGQRIGVRWPKGNLTWPCSKGMQFLTGGEAEIL